MLPSRGRIDSLDGLRTLAILNVFLVHSIPQLAGRGLGVQLFFTLSGYLITDLLMKEHALTGRVRLGRFYIRRLRRLYPALLVATAAASAVAFWLQYEHVASDALFAISYTSNFAQAVFGVHPTPIGVTWSLAVEEQFYLLWPLVLLGLLRFRPSSICVTLWTAGLLASGLIAWSFLTLGGQATYVLPFTQLPALLAGSSLAVLLRRSGQPRRMHGLIAAAAIAVLLVGVVVFRYGTPLLNFGGYPITALASFALIAFLILRPDHRLTRALSWRPMVWLGRRSYGFYLFHVTVITAVEALPLPSPLLQIPLAFVITVAVSAASWRWVEAPFTRPGATTTKSLTVPSAAPRLGRDRRRT